MGDFRIIIDAVGGHGVDRKMKDGETVDFFQDGEFSAEKIALRAIAEMKRFGYSISKARIIHWPIDNYPDQRTSQIEDDLLSGKRSGNF